VLVPFPISRKKLTQGEILRADIAYVKYFDYFCRAKAAAPAKKTLKNGLRPLNSKKAAFQSAE
jgi:hypothetical protein